MEKTNRTSKSHHYSSDVADIYKQLIEHTNGDFNKIRQMVLAEKDRRAKNAFVHGGKKETIQASPSGEPVNPDAVRFEQQMAKLRPLDSGFGVQLDGMYWQPGNMPPTPPPEKKIDDEYEYLSELPGLITIDNPHDAEIDFESIKNGTVGYGDEQAPAESTGMIDLSEYYSQTEPKQSIADEMILDKYFGKSKSSAVSDSIAKLKRGDELRNFQKMLYEKGYYGDVKAKMPKIANRSKEAYELQRMLVENGYDIGEYSKDKNGVDGIIGKKTKDAYEQYMKDHPEQVIEQVADGKIDSATIAAAKKYFKQVYDSGNESGISLSQRIYDNIPKGERISNFIGTAVPAIANARAIRLMNDLLGVDDILADNYNKAKDNYAKAKKGGNAEDIEVARKELEEAEKAMPLNILNRSKHLSKAEKRTITANLVGVNGERIPSYDEYLEIVKKFGKEPGDYIGTSADNSYDGQTSSYHIKNKFAKRHPEYFKHKGTPSNEAGIAVQLSKEILADPHRGRLGDFVYRILPDGFIEIKDSYTATEPRIIYSKNDSQSYRNARSKMPRASRAPIHGFISPDEYLGYIEEAYE